MATSPLYAATPHNAAGSLTTGNLNRDGTGAIVVIFTAGANGSKINEITVKATAQPADSTVVFYLYDGTTFWVYDEWDIGAPAAGSATVASYRETRTYTNLVLMTTWSLRASVTVTPTSGTIRAHAFGGDF